MKEIINCYDAKCPVLILRILAMFLALKFSVLLWTLHGNVPLHHYVYAQCHRESYSGCNSQGCLRTFERLATPQISYPQTALREVACTYRDGQTQCFMLPPTQYIQNATVIMPQEINHG